MQPPNAKRNDRPSPVARCGLGNNLNDSRYWNTWSSLGDLCHVTCAYCHSMVQPIVLTLIVHMCHWSQACQCSPLDLFPSLQSSLHPFLPTACPSLIHLLTSSSYCHCYCHCHSPFPPITLPSTSISCCASSYFCHHHPCQCCPHHRPHHHCPCLHLTNSCHLHLCQSLLHRPNCLKPLKRNWIAAK